MHSLNHFALQEPLDNLPALQIKFRPSPPSGFPQVSHPKAILLLVAGQHPEVIFQAARPREPLLPIAVVKLQVKTISLKSNKAVQVYTRMLARVCLGKLEAKSVQVAGSKRRRSRVSVMSRTEDPHTGWMTLASGEG